MNSIMKNYFFIIIIIFVVLFILDYLKKDKETFENFNDVYVKIYNKVHNDKEFINYNLNKIKTYFNKKNPVILETGCKTGNTTKLLNNKNYNLICSDDSSNMLHQFRINNPKIKFVESNLLNINQFNKNKFDYILALNYSFIMNSFKEQKLLLKNFSYWLKKNGLLFINCFDMNKIDPAPRNYSQYYKKNGLKHAMTYFDGFRHDGVWKNTNNKNIKIYKEKIIFKKTNNIFEKEHKMYFMNYNKIQKLCKKLGFKFIDFIDYKIINVDFIGLCIFKKI